MMIRIWKKSGETLEMIINNKNDMAWVETLAQKYDWEIDILGRRPW